VKIQCYSSVKKVSGKGLYEVPENLAVNPFNEQLAEFTFGQIMNHVHDINEKNTDLIGTIPGSCNLRDLPDVRINGGTILQHSAPLPQALFLMIDQNSNAINAIDYCGLEYQKFKENFLSQASATAYEGTAAERVDEIIGIIAGIVSLRVSLLQLFARLPIMKDALLMIMSLRLTALAQQKRKSV
jgi:hypothetical protein